MKVGNRVCRQVVTRQEAFTGSNLSGVEVTDTLYVVYSYGYWPCWACIDGHWYGHKSKYSSTTSAHTSGSRPDVDVSKITILETVDELKAKIKAAR